MLVLALDHPGPPHYFAPCGRLPAGESQGATQSAPSDLRSEVQYPALPAGSAQAEPEAQYRTLSSVASGRLAERESEATHKSATMSVKPPRDAAARALEGLQREGRVMASFKALVVPGPVPGSKCGSLARTALSAAAQCLHKKCRSQAQPVLRRDASERNRLN